MESNKPVHLSAVGLLALQHKRAQLLFIHTAYVVHCDEKFGSVHRVLLSTLPVHGSVVKALLTRIGAAAAAVALSLLRQHRLAQLVAIHPAFDSQ